ncbi:MAG: GNAT family N-acetyltransferase [Pseudomonadota bacterium]
MEDTRFSIRHATDSDAEAIAKVHVTAWREAYAKILPAQMLTGIDVAQRTSRWRKILQTKAECKDDMVAVSIRGKDILGFVSVGPQRNEKLRLQGFSAEIEALYVLHAEQRIGIGRALLRKGADHLLQVGHQAVALWVLEGNRPARAFYESIGADQIDEREDERGAITLKECAYGWPDLNKLASRR